MDHRVAGPQNKALVEADALQLSLFDEQNLTEITHPDYPGERLVCCRNPALAEQRTRKRDDLLAATEKELEKIAAATRRARRPLRGHETIGMRVGKVINHYKMAKHFTIEITDEAFTFSRKSDQINAEAALDGIYVLRTSLPEHTLADDDVVLRYKGLEDVERFFRTMNTELEVRPIRHRLADRLRAHVFLRTLSYYISWHMKQALAPILFYDNDKQSAAAKRTDPVATAERSDAALTKAACKRTEDNYPVHSFTSLLKDLAHPLRQLRPTRRRHAAIHQTHYPHPAAAAGLRTTRRLPPLRLHVGSTPNSQTTKHQVTPQHVTRSGELRARCCETDGAGLSMRSANSLTDSSPSTSVHSSRTRVGSASIRKTSTTSRT